MTPSSGPSSRGVGPGRDPLGDGLPTCWRAKATAAAAPADGAGAVVPGGGSEIRGALLRLARPLGRVAVARAAMAARAARAAAAWRACSARTREESSPWVWDRSERCWASIWMVDARALATFALAAAGVTPLGVEAGLLGRQVLACGPELVERLAVVAGGETEVLVAEEQLLAVALDQGRVCLASARAGLSRTAVRRPGAARNGPGLRRRKRGPRP